MVRIHSVIRVDPALRLKVHRGSDLSSRFAFAERGPDYFPAEHPETGDGPLRAGQTSPETRRRPGILGDFYCMNDGVSTCIADSA